ncbi:unnamed protein product, partial [Lymnaea stagnalis]
YALLSYTWLYCALGLPANTLTIITLLKCQTRSPASLLKVYLAVTDNTALVAKLVEANLKVYTVISSSFACKFFYVPSVTLTTIANWTLVLICAERFLTICCPLKRRQWISVKRCKIIFSSMSLGLLLYIFGFCYPLMIPQQLFLLVQGTFMVIIPFFVITALTGAVIRVLHKYQKERLCLFENSSTPQIDRMLNNIAASEQTTKVAARMENTLSLLMILAACLYFVVYAPYNVMILIVLPLCSYDRNVSLTTLVFFILADSSHVLNCFLYFSLVKGFRSDVLKVIRF